MIVMIDAPVTGSRPPHGDQTERPRPTFADSSGPLFSMYREMAEVQDKKLVESHQKYAEGILIFVSPRHISILLHNQDQICTVDRFILRGRCSIGRSDYP
jgi:hypothetical protein